MDATNQYKEIEKARRLKAFRKEFGIDKPEIAPAPEITPAQKTAETVIPADVPAAPQADAPGKVLANDNAILPRDIPKDGSKGTENVDLSSFGIDENYTPKLGPDGVMRNIMDFVQELPAAGLNTLVDGLNVAADGIRYVSDKVGVPEGSALQLFNKDGNFEPKWLDKEGVDAAGGLHDGMLPHFFRNENSETPGGKFANEMIPQALAGAADAINNTVELAKDTNKAAGTDTHVETILRPGDKYPTKVIVPGPDPLGNEEKGIIPTPDEAETAAGGMIRAMTNFVVGFLPASKGLKAAGMVNAAARGLAAGAVADGVVMDPHQERLATLLNEVPVLGSIVPEYMADNDPENETAWEGRFKNVLEGAGLGAGMEGLAKAFGKILKSYKIAKNAPKVTKDAAGTIADDLAGAEAKLAAQDSIVPMTEREIGVAQMVKDIETKPNDIMGVKKVVKTRAQSEAKAPHEFMADIDINPEKVLDENPEGITYFNHGKVNEVEQIHNVIQNMADKIDPKQGKMSLDEMSKASATEYKELSELLGRDTDVPFTSAQAVAAREVMVASANTLTELARIAKSANASPEDMFRFSKAVEVHGAIQEVVLKGRKATAQSLKSWDIRVGSNKDRVKQVNALLEGPGKNAAELADLVVSTAEKGGNVSTVIQRSLSGKFADAHYQLWVNGLLSSPATHVANGISNTATTLMSIPERYIKAGLEASTAFVRGGKEGLRTGGGFVTPGYAAMKAQGGDALIEANARAIGFFGGIQDGLRLMKNDDYIPGLANVSKIEGKMDAISANAWGADPDGALGKFLDFTGHAVGLPGKLLNLGDNFYKGVNYRMRLHESAAQTALEEGLQGNMFKARVAELLKNPTEAMTDVSKDFARYQTFTNETGWVANSLKTANRKAPALRYVIPFVNTPANILTYSFERTPLAFAMSGVRKSLMGGNGTAAATEAWARVATGSMLMASIVPLTLSGHCTGSGPAKEEDRKALMATGWRPYSFKIGDKYVSYERLEPISTLVGYTADISSIMGQLDEDKGTELVMAGMASFFRNLTNKTYLSGLTELTDVVTSGSLPRWERYVQRLGSSIEQPIYSSLGRKVSNYFDPVKRDFRADDEHSFLSQMWREARETIPFAQADAPPMRDVFGEEIRYDNGVFPLLESVSPIKVYKVDKDPVNNMIADNQISIGLPSRKVLGVETTDEEYSEYCKIAGEIARKELDDLWDYGTFEDITGGPEGEKAMIVKQVFRRARKAAAGKLLEARPEMEQRRVEAMGLRAALLTGEEQE